MRTKDDQKEIAIREKAIAMIVDEGFDGLSMQKLARAANISASTIYIYFENREDLLNRLFQTIEQRFEMGAMKNFDPAMSFEKGLWLQWMNRFHNIQENPLEFLFYEQFRNSPLIKNNFHGESTFKSAMNEFVQNAVTNKEIIKLPLEVWWANAFAPFYTLIKFDLNKSSMSGKSFQLNETILKQSFKLVIRALKF